VLVPISKNKSRLPALPRVTSTRSDPDEFRNGRKIAQPHRLFAEISLQLVGAKSECNQARGLGGSQPTRLPYN